jgi:hypothetical protein
MILNERGDLKTSCTFSGHRTRTREKSSLHGKEYVAISERVSSGNFVKEQSRVKPALPFAFFKHYCGRSPLNPLEIVDGWIPRSAKSQWAVRKSFNELILEKAPGLTAVIFISA